MYKVKLNLWRKNRQNALSLLNSKMKMRTRTHTHTHTYGMGNKKVKPAQKQQTNGAHRLTSTIQATIYLSASKTGKRNCTLDKYPNPSFHETSSADYFFCMSTSTIENGDGWNEKRTRERKKNQVEINMSDFNKANWISALIMIRNTFFSQMFLARLSVCSKCYRTKNRTERIVTWKIAFTDKYRDDGCVLVMRTMFRRLWHSHSTYRDLETDRQTMLIAFAPCIYIYIFFSYKRMMRCIKQVKSGSSFSLSFVFRLYTSTLSCSCEGIH